MKNLFIVIGSLTADARDALAGAIGGAILGSGAGGVEAGPRAVVENEQWRFGVNL